MELPPPIEEYVVNIDDAEVESSGGLDDFNLAEIVDTGQVTYEPIKIIEYISSLSINNNWIVNQVEENIIILKLPLISDDVEEAQLYKLYGIQFNANEDHYQI